jgi:hypothetical protein
VYIPAGPAKIIINPVLHKIFMQHWNKPALISQAKANIFDRKFIRGIALRLGCQKMNTLTQSSSLK